MFTYKPIENVMPSNEKVAFKTNSKQLGRTKAKNYHIVKY